MTYSSSTNFFLLLNTKEGILKNVGNQTVDRINLTSIGERIGLLWKSMGVWLPTLFKISYFVFNRRKTLIQAC